MRACLNIAGMCVAALCVLVACSEEPMSSDLKNDKGSEISGKPGGGGTPANPQVVYASDEASNRRVGVMDASTANQTVLYTAAGTVTSVNSPSWSSGTSVSWLERTGTTYAIRALDVSVGTNGVPTASNVRTVASLNDTNFYMKAPAWSSTSNNEVAFGLLSTANGQSTVPNYLCIVSASGGTWDTVYATAHNTLIKHIAWNYDDSKLAVEVFSSSGMSIVIIDRSTKEITDSISMPQGVYEANGLEWSRGSSSPNKLVFSNNGSIYYLEPTEGSTPTTNGVTSGQNGGALAKTPTWSPDNASVMFLKVSYSNKCHCDVYSLELNTAQTTTVTTLDNTFIWSEISWHR